jgi:hypothetical protein
MAKTFQNRGNSSKGSFSRKKKEYTQWQDLAESGYKDLVQNAKRFKSTDLEYDEYDDRDI